MHLELTKENMKTFFPSWLKPLSDKEILDFLNCEITEEKRLWFPEWKKDLKNSKKNGVDKSQPKQYTTKKEILQDIKILNNNINEILEKKRESPNEQTRIFYDLIIEDYLIIKNKLTTKLQFFGRKLNTSNKEQALLTPIESILEFNRAGFARCPFHDEKTASLHKIPKSNLCYCFGCHKTANVIDIYMQINNYNFKKAIDDLTRN